MSCCEANNNGHCTYHRGKLWPTNSSIKCTTCLSSRGSYRRSLPWPPGFVNSAFLIMVVVSEKHYIVSSKLQELGFVVLVPNLLNSGSDILILILVYSSRHITIILVHSDIFLLLAVILIYSCSSSFALKVLGQLQYFLGTETTRLVPASCLKEVYNISSSSCQTGWCKTMTHSNSKQKPLSLYRSIVGALQCLTITRQVLTFLAKFVNFIIPNVVKRILKYLKALLILVYTYNLRIPFHFSLCAVVLIIIIPALEFIFIGPNIILLSSKKQWVVARLSTESKYWALTYVIAEIVWSKTSMCLYISVLMLLCDNIGATYLTANPIFYA